MNRITFILILIFGTLVNLESNADIALYNKFSFKKDQKNSFIKKKYYPKYNYFANELMTKSHSFDNYQCGYQDVSVWQDILEISKISLMSSLGAILYGICHDLITTQIDFDYFVSDKTHHGPVTRKNFPWVYKSKSKILYALLWGTISTWWVGLPIGIGMGIAARAGRSRHKIGYKKLIKPVVIYLGGLLLGAISVGAVSYAVKKDTFNSVANMHSASYILGALGGIGMMIYTYKSRPQVSYSFPKL